MRSASLFVALFMLTIPMAGCMDNWFGSDGTSSEPRTIELELIINAGDTTIPLYTLNDGKREMEVVAMGFQFSDQGITDLSVPNPELRLQEGDTLILTVRNFNRLPHTFHLHGGLVDWEMDGVPFLNQMPIHQNGSYEYVFKDLKAGTYFYHCHVDVAHHIDLGMYGAFIVEEKKPPVKSDREYVLMLDEWDNCHVHGNVDPLTGAENSGESRERAECVGRFIQDNYGQNTYTGQVVNNPTIDPGRDAICAAYAALPPDQQNQTEPAIRQLNCGGGHAITPATQDPRSWYPMTFPTYNPEYNTFLINGKAFPDTETLVVKEGDTVRLRLINVGEEIHSMHLHGHTMTVTHRDGYVLQAPFKVDTLGIMPGERYDVIVKADNPGMWAFHDHVGLNVMNDHASPGGMFTCMAYQGFHDYTWIDDNYMRSERALLCLERAQEIFASEGHTEHA